MPRCRHNRHETLRARHRTPRAETSAATPLRAHAPPPTRPPPESHPPHTTSSESESSDFWHTTSVQLRLLSCQSRQRVLMKRTQFTQPAATNLLGPIRVHDQRPPQRYQIKLAVREPFDQFIEPSNRRSFLGAESRHELLVERHRPHSNRRQPRQF